MRVFEDFVPISATEALITTGPRSLTALDQIELVRYSVAPGGLVRLGRTRQVLATGTHLRLGGLVGEQLVYSDGFEIRRGEDRVDLPGDPHQPFMYRGSMYYTAEWPYVRIHRDGARFLDHFGPMVQVSNPHWTEGLMFFECRDTIQPNAPDVWQVWALPEGKTEPFRICAGANPAYYDGALYVGRWGGRVFDYYRVEL